MKRGMEGREESLGTGTRQGSGAGEEMMSSRDSVQGVTQSCDVCPMVDFTFVPSLTQLSLQPKLTQHTL